jgi:DnaJ-class molecular chaperone
MILCEEVCDTCGGTGGTIDDICPVCNGTGYMGDDGDVPGDVDPDLE